MNKMSEDEAIKILKDETDYLCEDKDKAIETILDLYQKEKERIELYMANGSNIKLEIYIKQNYISKDKIREKIKEINTRRIEDGQCELALHGFQREAKIAVLEELLEEE